jgi:hypothetical protein
MAIAMTGITKCLMRFDIMCSFNFIICNAMEDFGLVVVGSRSVSRELEQLS